jgi:hypothetical protein
VNACHLKDYIKNTPGQTQAIKTAVEDLDESAIKLGCIARPRGVW